MYRLRYVAVNIEKEMMGYTIETIQDLKGFRIVSYDTYSLQLVMSKPSKHST